MTTYRVTRTGPAHAVTGTRAVCSGAHATLPAGDDSWPCRLCARTAERRRRARADVDPAFDPAFDAAHDEVYKR